MSACHVGPYFVSNQRSVRDSLQEWIDIYEFQSESFPSLQAFKHLDYRIQLALDYFD